MDATRAEKWRNSGAGKFHHKFYEMLNESLAYGRFTSLASVAFRRRHFRLNSDKLPSMKLGRDRVTPEFFKTLLASNEAKKSWREIR